MSPTAPNRWKKTNDTEKDRERAKGKNQDSRVIKMVLREAYTPLTNIVAIVLQAMQQRAVINKWNLTFNLKIPSKRYYP